jgi:hypothetical protein
MLRMVGISIPSGVIVVCLVTPSDPSIAAASPKKFQVRGTAAGLDYLVLLIRFARVLSFTA